MHVDVVRNDWAAGKQIRVAAVEDTTDGLRVTHAALRWTDLEQRLLSLNSDHTTTLAECSHEVAEAFQALQSTYSSSYVFTTPPHDDSACPFSKAEIVIMESS